MPNDLKASRDQANQFNKHFVSIASSIVDNNQPATPDLSHIVSFVNDSKPSTANFEIPLLDVNSLDKLIKSFPTCCYGSRWNKCSITKAHLPGYS